MTAFHDVRLPIDIERGAKGGPGFKTTIITLSSGHETRNTEWAITRGQWNVGYGIRKRIQMEAVYAFFLARKGMAFAFRFRDWIDYTITGEDMAAVSGQPTKRQLVKVYPDTVASYTRVIGLPVASTLVVYVDNIATVAYTLSGGVVTFTGGDPGGNVKASCEFDVLARFDSDQLEIDLNTYMEGAMPNIPIIEVKA